MKLKQILSIIAVTVLFVCISIISVSAESKVVVSQNSDYTGIAVSGDISIEGSTPDITLALPATISLNGNLKIDNITLSGTSTIYANGYLLEIGENVTSANRLTVYGGKNGASVASTDVRLYGGQYQNVYGGGNNGAVSGNTNVIIGGNFNPGDGIDDQASNLSPCYVYGGSNNAAVSGSTNITMEGNATTRYLVGAGAGTGGTAVDINIYINGGKVMNVYAGSTKTTLTNCNTHITMTGGMAEALFGGSENFGMTGNTCLTLLGGDVTRRVYTGCYNDWGLGSGWLPLPEWKSSYFVNGTTTLVLGPDMLLNTHNGLHSENTTNTGVFAGSRLGKNGNSNEINTIIYLDGCYSKQSSKIGDKSGFSWVFYSNAKYTVNAGAGGKVFGTNTGGTIYVEPAGGKYAEINGGKYINRNVNISTGTTAVTFHDDFIINDVTAEKTDSGVDVAVQFASVNVAEESTPSLYAAVYDDAGKLIVSNKIEPSSDMTVHTFNLQCDIDTVKQYRVKVMLWNADIKSLCEAYSINI